MELDRRLSAKAALAVGASSLVLLAAGRYATAAALILLDGLLTFQLNRYQLGFIGVEIGSAVTVAAGYVHGPEAGAAVGLLSAASTALAARAFGPFLLWTVPGAAAIGAIAGLAPAGLVATGVAAVGTVRAAFLALEFRLQPSVAPKGVIYQSSSVAFTGAVLSAAGGFLTSVV